LLVLALAAALTGGGWTYALWSGSTSFWLGTLTNGRLAVDDDRTRTWELRSATDELLAADAVPGKPDLSVGDLANLTTPCGDGVVLKITDTYDLDLAGDNLTVALTVDWADRGPGGQYAVGTDASGSNIASGAIDRNSALTVDIPSNATAVTIEQTLNMPICDVLATAPQSAKGYGGYRLEVVQT
jgi:hypothetical protein